MSDLSQKLTVVIPTRDHLPRVSRQLGLFAGAELRAPIIVADSSSDPGGTAPFTEAASVQHRPFPPGAGLHEKIAAVLVGVDTPFVLLSPDRKISLPHAVEAALGHLDANPDYAAASGYVVGFAKDDESIDINRVVYFTPSIDEPEPLARHYHLMRRYQSSLWALFRREVLVAAVEAAMEVSGSMFRELMFMNAVVLQGKLARLRLIFRAEGAEQSNTPLNELHPLYLFLNNSTAFFRQYAIYRRALIRFIGERGIPPPPGATLGQLIDTVNGVFLHANFDGGVLNHAARLHLGAPIAPLDTVQYRPPRREVDEGDLVHATANGRRVVWRRDVLAAEPRDEITITPEEIEQVERELDWYFAG